MNIPVSIPHFPVRCDPELRGFAMITHKHNLFYSENNSKYSLENSNKPYCFSY